MKHVGAQNKRINGCSPEIKTTTSKQRTTEIKIHLLVRKEGCSLYSILHRNHELILICTQGACFSYHTNSAHAFGALLIALLTV